LWNRNRRHLVCYRKDNCNKLFREINWRISCKVPKYIKRIILCIIYASCIIMPSFRVKNSAYGAVLVSISHLLYPRCALQDRRSVGYFFISFFAHDILNLMHRVNSNQPTKFVICENCLHTDSICAFYDANRYCVECLCDHACCPECSSGYHAITIAD
jgi:hypothetical protein